MYEILLAIVVHCNTHGCLMVDTPDRVLITLCSGGPIEHFEADLSHRHLTYNGKGLVVNTDNCISL